MNIKTLSTIGHSDIQDPPARRGEDSRKKPFRCCLITHLTQFNPEGMAGF